MNTNSHLDIEDLALFAMRLLSPSESAAIQQHLSECPACRQEFSDVYGDLALYAFSIERQSPAPEARERLLKQVAREKKVILISAPERATPATIDTLQAGAQRPSLLESELPRRNVALRVLPWLGWAAAIAVAVFAGDLYQQRAALQGTVAQQSQQVDHLTADAADAAAARRILETMTDASAMRVTLNRSKTAPVPQAHATYIADQGSLIFLASNMQPLAPDKIYELWIIPADGRDPVPAGTFRPDQRGDASLILPPLPKGIPAKAFGVTVEDQGGAQTPTLPIIMVGA